MPACNSGTFTIHSAATLECHAADTEHNIQPLLQYIDRRLSHRKPQIPIFMYAVWSGWDITAPDFQYLSDNVNNMYDIFHLNVLDFAGI